MKELKYKIDNIIYSIEVKKGHTKNSSIQLFTGQVDSSGREIYIGDTVYSNSEECFLEVSWNNTAGCIELCDDSVCFTFDNFYSEELDLVYDK